MDCTRPQRDGTVRMIYTAFPKAQYLTHQCEIDAAISRVLHSGNYILDENVASFEAEFAQYIGCRHAVALGSGTDALHLGLKALGIGEGDEVITPSLTATATISAIYMAGAKPLFIDIEEDYFTLDPNLLEKVMTPRTKAIIAVHLYGQPADMNPIMQFAKQHHLKIIEDCAQATGAQYHNKKVGSLGDIGCFSFFPTKNLGAMGDGGMITTNQTPLMEKLVALRQYGWDKNRVSQIHGYNSRLDEIQAAILRVKLPFLNQDNTKRNQLAQTYFESLLSSSIKQPITRAHCTHAFHLYVICTRHRKELLELLNKNNIKAAIHYEIPVHQMPCYFNSKLHLPNTERLATQILSLPLYPELSASQQQFIIATIRKYIHDTHKHSASIQE